MSIQGRFCPNCGAPRIGNFRYCTTCRFDFDEGVAPAAPPPIETRPAVTTPAPFSGLADTPAPPRPEGGMLASIVKTVLAALIGLGILYVVFNGGVHLPSGSGSGPQSANIPPAGQVWFGRSFDTATFEINNRVTTVGTSESFVAVAQLPRSMKSSEILIRSYFNDDLVGSQSINATGEGELWGVNLGPMFAAGRWKFEFADIGGNLLASGLIAVE